MLLRAPRRQLRKIWQAAFTQRAVAAAKLEIPSTKLQRNTKIQTSRGARRAVWSLVIGASLELGCWSFELFLWLHFRRSIRWMRRQCLAMIRVLFRQT
jgi:C4-dicarboxylate-specific signal transduction histidine kinase